MSQTLITLSSGEAEHYGVQQEACESLGIRSIAQDIGVLLGINSYCDRSAARGIRTEIGIGKAKHLDT